MRRRVEWSPARCRWKKFRKSWPPSHGLRWKDKVKRSHERSDEVKSEWADVIRRRGIDYIKAISSWSDDADWPSFGHEPDTETTQRLALVIMESVRRYQRYFEEVLGY